MTRIINGKVISDIEAAQETIPDVGTLSGTTGKRIGQGKKSSLQNIIDTAELENERGSRN